MKFSLIYFSLIYVYANIYGQGGINLLKSTDCNYDSIGSFLNEIDSLGITRIIHLDTILKVKTYKISDVNLLKLKTGDSCSFILYVLVFDRLILNGLDLQFDYAKNQPYRVSVMGMAGDDLSGAYIQRDINIEKLRVYKNFLTIKEYYEEYIVDKRVFKSNNHSFHKMVNSTIIHGHSTNPIFLQKILLSKYKHLTEDKLERKKRRYTIKYVLN